MSRKSRRRRRTWQDPEAWTLTGRQRLRTLEQIRHWLAASIVALEVHELPEAADGHQGLAALEQLIRAESPQWYADRAVDWLRHDANVAARPDLAA